MHELEFRDIYVEKKHVRKIKVTLTYYLVMLHIPILFRYNNKYTLQKVMDEQVHYKYLSL